MSSRLTSPAKPQRVQCPAFHNRAAGGRTMYYCVLDEGHDSPHKDEFGDKWTNWGRQGKTVMILTAREDKPFAIVKLVYPYRGSEGSAEIVGYDHDEQAAMRRANRVGAGLGPHGEGRALPVVDGKVTVE